jgi:hypothetical protein
MRIVSLRPGPGGTGRWAVDARFDFEVTADFRALNWILKRNPAGAWRVYPPEVKAGGHLAATISPSLRIRLTEIAVAAFNEIGVQNAHEQQNAA